MARERKRKAKNSRHTTTTIEALVIAGIILLGIAYVLIPATPTTRRQPAPLFSVTLLDGTTFQLVRFRGRVVILDFMDTTCTPCYQTETEIYKVYQQYGNSIIVLSISVDPADTLAELATYPQDFPWFWAKDDGLSFGAGTIATLYQIRGTPTLVMIDPSGLIAYRNEGLTLSDMLSNEVASLQ
jgi:thiol-disulfide isomerase/thioredoxin